MKKIEILTPAERMKKDKENYSTVRIARKHTDIDKSNFAIDIISCMKIELVKEDCNSFKKKLELGKLKNNVATNLVTGCIDTYCKNGVDIPNKAFNIYIYI